MFCLFFFLTERWDYKMERSAERSWGIQKTANRSSWIRRECVGRDVAWGQREARLWRTRKSWQGCVFYLVSYRDPLMTCEKELHDRICILENLSWCSVTSAKRDGNESGQEGFISIPWHSTLNCSKVLRLGLSLSWAWNTTSFWLRWIS